MKQILVQYKYYESIEKQLDEIKREYEKDSYKSILFHVYSGILDDKLIGDITSGIKTVFPDAPIVGTISAGEIKNAKLMDRGILISAMLFESTEIRKIKFHDVKDYEVEVGSSIRKEVDSIPDLKAVELLLAGTEFKTRPVLEEISHINPDIKVFGGYAGGHDMAIGEHFVFDEEGLDNDELFVICYIGKDFHIDIDKSVGWRTLGRHFTVTKADENRLIEIDGAPAVEVYEKYLSIKNDEKFAEETFEFPLIVKVERDELLRHTISVEENGTLDLAGYVTEGMKIYLCYGDPSYIVTKVNERLEAVRKFKPEAILLYSCSVRKSFWEKYVDMEMLPFEEMAVTAGFHTWGEVKRNPETNSVLEYNITLLSIAMREGEADEVELPPIRIDDSVLQGQASLVKRLTQLVSATTTELQNAYKNLTELNKELVRISNHDSLTGICNRRRFEELTEQVIRETAEKHGHMSMIMMDLDFFKSVNDTYGHLVGDDVLKEFAGILENSVDDYDGAIVGRWGGEEFIVTIPDFDKNQAVEYAEKLRKDVEKHRFKGVDYTITLSLGLLISDGSDDRLSMIKHVDDSLYAAKDNGRNRFILYNN
ncbi:MAG: GGDEF domain-containing protein [Eubacterium sp.]|nr:GGDEF domain-containing protein [Eubacterium sp.]